MRFKFCAIAFCLVSTLVIAQNQATNSAMTEEETLVRSAYAKLAYAARIGTIKQIIDDYHMAPASTDNANILRRIKESELAFTLNSIRVGSFSEIAQVPYGDLVTKPNGEDVLSVTIGRWVYTTDEPRETTAAIATPSWIKAQTLTEDWSVPFAAAIKMAQNAGTEDLSPYNRYAAVDITVAFQGKSRSYHALFEFGKDDNGATRMLPIDTVTGGPVLSFYIKNSVYPATLLETEMRNIPFVSQWLRDNIMPNAIAGKRDVGCNLTTLRCGLAAEDVQRALAPAAASRPTALVPRGHQKFVEVGFHPRTRASFFMQSDPCSVFNFTTGPTPGSTPFDTQFHITGNHFMSFNMSSSCTYASGNNSNGACNTQCSASIGASANESGTPSSSCHNAVISQQVGGSANANGAGVSCNSSVAMGVKACLFCQCSLNFTVTGSGGSVTITSDGFYTVQQNNNQTCSEEIAGSGPGGGGLGNPCLNASVPSNGPIGLDDSPECSPIILDIGEEGFHLTSARAGVVFDITGTGHPVQIAWTDPHFRNAFLALPGSDGLVHDGKELFGNFTPQPPSDRPNGFLALAQYDLPENGGNGDGIIDERDAIFSRLRLWIDENHDGICQPSELHALSELGVSSISLKYHFSRLEDQYGNVFRYRARLNPEPPDDQSEVGKTVYDVFLTVTK